MNNIKSIIITTVVLLAMAASSFGQVAIYRPARDGLLAFEPNATTLINGRAGTIVWFDTLRIPANLLTGYSDVFQVGYVNGANADSNKIRMRFDTDMFYLIVKLDTLLLSATFDGDSVRVDSMWFEYKPLSTDSSWWCDNSDSTNYFAGSASSSIHWQVWRNAPPPETAAAGIGRTRGWGYPLAIRTPGYYRFGVHTTGTACRVYLYLIMIPSN